MRELGENRQRDRKRKPRNKRSMCKADLPVPECHCGGSSQSHRWWQCLQRPGWCPTLQLAWITGNRTAALQELRKQTFSIFWKKHISHRRGLQLCAQSRCLCQTHIITCKYHLDLTSYADIHGPLSIWTTPTLKMPYCVYRSGMHFPKCIDCNVIPHCQPTKLLTG